MKFNDPINIKKYELIVLDLDGTLTVRDTLVDFSIFIFKRYPIRLFLFFILCFSLKYRFISNIRFKKLYVKYLLKGFYTNYISKYLEKWFIERGIKLIRNIFIFNDFIIHPNKIIISSNFSFIVEKFAIYLNVKDFFATKPEIKGGVFTGKIMGKIPYGEDKVNLLLSKYDIDMIKERAIAFGNDEADFEVLKIVHKGINIEKEPEINFLSRN